MTANGTKKQTQSKNGVTRKNGAGKRLRHPDGREAPELSISRLMIVMYVPGTTRTIETPATMADEVGVAVDLVGGFWTYSKEAKERRHQYRIGHCIRPTKEENRSGPMMVYDLDEPQQVKWMREAVRNLKKGTLDVLAAPGPKGKPVLSTLEVVN